MITSSLMLAFIMFAFVSSITPGPNNTMLLASGITFGVRRSVPHMLGVTIGFAIMILIIGFGLGEVFEKYPILYVILRYIGAAYLIYLAWKISRSGQTEIDPDLKKPTSFLQAAAFQWSNPKAWVMAIAAVTTYAPKQNFFVNVIIITLVYIVFVALSGWTWTACGNWLRRFLHQPHYLKIFNNIMAILLILSLYPLLFTNL